MGQPVITLPSINEDDENQDDIEPIITLSPQLSSLNRSPLHSTGSPARNLKLLNRGKSLAALRERVERQRSLNAPAADDLQSNSLDGLNLERGNEFKLQRRQSVERLDNQVSALHEDVATLSSEVRNAIQALQDMSFSTLASRADLLQNTRSIPNMLTNALTSTALGSPSIVVATTGATLSPSSALPGGSMPRSSSQPTEMWSRSGAEDSGMSSEEQLRSYILANREEVLRLLGVEMQPVVQVTQALNSIPEMSQTSAAAPNSRSASNDFIYGGTTGVWSTTNNGPADTATLSSPSTVVQDADADGIERPQLTIVNESTAGAQPPPAAAMLRSRSERLSRNHVGGSAPRMPRSSASDAEVNVVRKSQDTAYLGHQQQPLPTSVHSSRRLSWRDSNISYRTMQFDDNPTELENHRSSSSGVTVGGAQHYHHYQHGAHSIVVDSDDGGDGSQTIRIQPDDEPAEHSEKSSLIGNEMHHPATDASATVDAEAAAAATGVIDRHYLAPRQRVNYRFSAGDADKLERGIRTISSTRSLRDN